MKLDFVYDFVEKFNLSKQKIKEYLGIYGNDTYQILDVNPDERDTFAVTYMKHLIIPSIH